MENMNAETAREQVRKLKTRMQKLGAQIGQLGRNELENVQILHNTPDVQLPEGGIIDREKQATRDLESVQLEIREIAEQLGKIEKQLESTEK